LHIPSTLTALAVLRDRDELMRRLAEGALGGVVVSRLAAG
jgi:hypothetical protein